MTRPSEHEEVRDLIAHWVIGTGYYSTSIATDEAGEIAEAILASDWVAERDRRMKAEAWTEGWNAAVTAPPYAMHPQPLPCVASSLPAGDLCVCPKCEGVPNPYA